MEHIYSKNSKVLHFGKANNINLMQKVLSNSLLKGSHKIKPLFLPSVNKTTLAIECYKKFFSKVHHMYICICICSACSKKHLTWNTAIIIMMKLGCVRVCDSWGLLFFLVHFSSNKEKSKFHLNIYCFICAISWFSDIFKNWKCINRMFAIKLKHMFNLLNK